MAKLHRSFGLLALAAAILLPSLEAAAQTTTLRGTVRDSLSRQPLQSASVMLRQGDLVQYGTATDGDGYFVIPRVRTGDYELIVSFVGFLPSRIRLTVPPQGMDFLRVSLLPAAETLDEIVVEGDQEGGMSGVRAGMQVVRPADMQRVPVLGASGDLAAYLQTLPGIAAQGDRGGQIFVRGGSTDQNLALLDGMPIYQPFHVVSFYSAFPEEIVDHADVYTGAFGAEYSTRLSSVIDVTMRNGNKERIAGSVSAAPFLSGIRLEGPLLRDRVSFVGSVRQSLVEELTPDLFGQRLPYRFGDRFAKLHALVGSHHTVSVTGLSTSDRGDIAGTLTGFDGDFVPEDRDSSIDREVSWSNRVTGGRYTYRSGGLPFFLELLASTSSSENSVGSDEQPEREARIESRDASATATIFTSIGEIRAGSRWRQSDMEYRLGGQFQDLEEGSRSATEISTFLELVSNPGRITLNPGMSVYVLPDRNGLEVDPRLRLTWRVPIKVGVHSIHAGVGRFHQLITGLSDERDVGNVFTVWVPAADTLDVPESWHVMGGWTSRVPQGVSFSIEGFLKSFSSLSVPVFTPFPSFSTELQTADGTAVGLDVRLESDPRPFVRGSTVSGFIGYSVSDVEYRTPDFSYKPPHHRRHQVSAMARLERNGVGITIQWQYGSGYPLTRSAGFDVWQYLTPESNVSSDPGTVRVLYLEPFGGRQPNYERVDLWLDKTVDVGRARATVRAGVMNLLNRDNLFYFDLFTLRRVNQMPIIPSVAFRLDLL